MDPVSGGTGFGQVGGEPMAFGSAVGGLAPDFAADQYIGQIKDMGSRFVGALNWLRQNTVKLTRVNYMIYTGPPAYNDYLPTVPFAGPRLQYDPSIPAGTPYLWFFPNPLVLQQTSTQSPMGATTGLVPQDLMPEIPDSDPWLLSAHGYYEGRSVQG